MDLREFNRWDVTAAEAQGIQLELAAKVIREGEPAQVRRVAGVDVALPEGTTRAAIVIDDFPSLTQLESSVAALPLFFPYVPGLLSFRELPSVVAAFRGIQQPPDLVIVDGHGIAHPRRLGIASHLGLLLDVPTIGCAKSILTGHHAPVGDVPGDWSPLLFRGETIGAAVRTRPKVTPVYVSIGNRIGLVSAIDWVLRCCRGYRLPEPQRQAHRVAGSD